MVVFISNLVPVYWHALILFLIYVLLAGSSPTRTTQRDGERRPSLTIFSTSNFTSSFISLAILRPSINLAANVLKIKKLHTGILIENWIYRQVTLRRQHTRDQCQEQYYNPLTKDRIIRCNKLMKLENKLFKGFLKQKQNIIIFKHDAKRPHCLPEQQKP